MYIKTILVFAAFTLCATDGKPSAGVNHCPKELICNDLLSFCWKKGFEIYGKIEKFEEMKAVEFHDCCYKDCATENCGDLENWNGRMKELYGMGFWAPRVGRPFKRPMINKVKGCKKA